MSENSQTKKSSIWSYFDMVDSSSAKCKLCLKTFKRSQGNTSNLTAHLKRDHRKEHQEKEEEDSRRNCEEEAMKQVRICDCDFNTFAL